MKETLSLCRRRISQAASTARPSSSRSPLRRLLALRHLSDGDSAAARSAHYRPAALQDPAEDLHPLPHGKGQDRGRSARRITRLRPSCLTRVPVESHGYPSRLVPASSRCSGEGFCSTHDTALSRNTRGTASIPVRYVTLAKAPQLRWPSLGEAPWPGRPADRGAHWQTPRAPAVSHDFAVTVVDQKFLALVLNTGNARGSMADRRDEASVVGVGQRACCVVGLEMRR